MAFDLGPRLRAAVMENLPLKLLSLTFALVLYSLVHGAQDAKANVLVNVSYHAPQPSARELMTAIPGQIVVTLRGARPIVTDVQEKGGLGISFDLTGTETRVNFDASMLHLPPGVEVDQIQPAFLDLTWENHVARDVSVQASVVGVPKQGFVLKGVPTADPKSVMVEGPETDVVTLQNVRAQPYDVGGLEAGKYEQERLLEPRRGVQFGVKKVKITFEIARETVEHYFTKLAVAIIGAAKAKAQPGEVDAQLTCPPDVLRGLRPELLVPRVDVDVPGERGSDVFAVQLPMEGCEVRVTPATVVVKWERPKEPNAKDPKEPKPPE